jgi:tRNA G18 (ribose-2'-O)-methylase SpoU
MFAEEFFVLCQNIRSTYNVGSLFRTADAAAITKLYLCGYTPTPPRYEISKVALGAELNVPWEGQTQLWRAIEALQAKDFQIVALENNVKSISIYDFMPRFPLALLLGNEVGGLSPKILSRADAVVHLPMFGKKESLNVSVAFGIAAYELNKYRK